MVGTGISWTGDELTVPTFSSTGRLALATAFMTGLLFTAGPASAHVEAAAEAGAQAGGPMTITFTAEAESGTAGKVSQD